MRSVQIYTAEGRLNTKLQRQRDIIKADEEDLPPSYKSNSIKEELCLEYIHSFISQFSAIYPKRKTPYMVAENEFGVRKFVGSTLRPTLVPIPELYDMYECASFLAGYVLYEPLDPSMDPPRHLFSPQLVLESHRGDCFDMANLLCSFLLGAGYDAYVVHGYAPKFIALKDQSATRCPIINERNLMSETATNTNSPTERATTASSAAATRDNNDSNQEDASNSYIPPDNSVKSSRFLQMQEEAQRLLSIDKFTLWLGDEDALQDDDQLFQASRAAAAKAEARETYAHCWVLVKSGRRDVPEHLFVEPSTGRVYRPTHSPYLAIEAIWNHVNYHVNSDLDAAVSALDFNFHSAQRVVQPGSGERARSAKKGRGNSSPVRPRSSAPGSATAAPTLVPLWETLFLGDAQSSDKSSEAQGDTADHDNPESSLPTSARRDPNQSGEGKGGDGSGNGAGSGAGGPALRFFDAPPHWSLPLSLPRARYLAKYPPSGRRTVQYHCAKADFFARGTNDQGMVLRITRYLDQQCTLVQEVSEWYENRADKLYKRVRTYLNTKMNPSTPIEQGYFHNLGTSGRLGESLQTTAQLTALFGARKIVNYYQSGARDDIQCWTEYPGKCTAVDYFVAGRLDRMLRRVEVLGECICEWFTGRHDRLEYRETLVTTDRALALHGSRGHGAGSSVPQPPLTAGSTRGSVINPAGRSSAATPAAPPGSASTSTTAAAGRHYLIARSNHLTMDLYITRMTLDYGKDKAIKDGSDIARRTFFIREGKAIFVYHCAHQQVAGKMKTVFHTRNPGANASAAAAAGGPPGTAAGGTSAGGAASGTGGGAGAGSGGPAALSDAALAQETGLDESLEILQEAGALEREYYGQIKASCQEHEKLVDAVLQVELTGNAQHVAMEYTVFDQALDKVDAFRATQQPMSRYNPYHGGSGAGQGGMRDTFASSLGLASSRDSNNNANAANKGVDYLAPFLKHVHDPNQLTREEALAIRQAALDALKARLVERASIIQSKLHEENNKLAKRQEQFQRSQREGDYSTEDFEKYCTEAMFRIQILENRLTAHEDSAPQKYAALDAKLANDPRLKILKA